MAFTGVSAMDLKQEFVRLALVEGVNRRAPCRRFGVSATLGYRLLARYQAEGEAGLAERSRRPIRSPERTAEAVEAAVLAGGAGVGGLSDLARSLLASRRQRFSGWCPPPPTPPLEGEGSGIHPMDAPGPAYASASPGGP